MSVQDCLHSRIIEWRSSQQNIQNQKFSCTRSLKVNYWSTRFNGAIIVGTSSDEAEFLASWFSHTACLDVSFEATRLFQTQLSIGRFSPVWFFNIWFSNIVFLDAHFIAVGKSQTKVRRIFSSRMELVGRIIFQCPIGNAIIGSANVLTLTLLMPGCCCSITFFQKCWHVIFYVKGIDALFSSPDF